MTSCFRSAVVLALLSALASAQGSSGLDVNATIMLAADRDGGGVSAEEWSAHRAYLASTAALAEGTEGDLDRRLVLANLFIRFWDEDKDLALTTSDLDALFARLDQDANGELNSKELRPEGGSAAGFFSRRILMGYVDTDTSGSATREEWAALAGGVEGELSLEHAYQWLDAALSAPPPANKNAVTPGVYLLTLDAGLDADFSGKLTLADFDQIFSALDLDQSGELSTKELAAQPRTPRADRGTSTPMSRVKLAGPLMPWQRSLDDAIAVAKRTGKPLLICVNIDGESASETLASYQYRNPAFVELVRGFVPVLFSPDSHNPREYDDRGRRLPDPKFGRVITSEHTSNETELYERYFSGTRVAPRHVGATADGEILFDIKLVNDLSIIDRALEKHGVFGDEALLAVESASEQQLLESPDAGFRDRLEALFATGDIRTRVRLASLALSSARATQHPALLRMAFLDDEQSVRSQAVWTAIQHTELLPTELFLSAIEATNGGDEADLLLAALDKEALDSNDEERRLRAERLTKVFRALSKTSTVLDPERWKLALAFAPVSVELEPAAEQTSPVSKRLNQLEKLLEVHPDDRELNLLFTDTLIRLARIQLLSGGNPTYLFEDARLAAMRTTTEAEPSARGLGYLAWANYQLLDATAVDYAAQALPLLRSDAGSPLTSHVLQIFAQTRLSGFYSALSENREWPAEWLADIRDVHEVLMIHPSLTEAQVVGYVGFLGAIEAYELQGDVLRRGLELFPGSNDLHMNLRAQALHAGGADGLAAAYDEFDVSEENRPTFEWYTGFAQLVAAERHVQNGQSKAAQSAYRQAVDHFRESFRDRADYKGSADHYIALALAGSARLYTTEASFDQALAAIQEGLATSPNSSAVRDGLGNTPAATASLLHRALLKEGRATEASALREVLDGQGL